MGEVFRLLSLYFRVFSFSTRTCEFNGSLHELLLINVRISCNFPRTFLNTRSQKLQNRMMNSTDELIQNVIDTMDNAHSQKLQLTQQLDSLMQAKQQVLGSTCQAKGKVKSHFETLEKSLCCVLKSRMKKLLGEIESLEAVHMEPLQQCEDMINHHLTDATACMEQGKNVLESGPEEHVEDLLKFKDATLSKDLNTVPEVPCLSEVAYVDVVFYDDLSRHVEDLILEEGRLFDRAPVQITEVEERPGAILVSWEEVDEDIEVAEFRLQYCYGRITASTVSSATFHNAYTGPKTSHLVRRLHMNKPYSFRVSCRGEKEENWSVWSVPTVAQTNISHYEWDDSVDAYCTSIENKTGTRSTGLTRVLYSKSQSYKSGYPLSFRILDSGEKSPFDGIGIAVTNDDIDTMKREGAVFLACDGTVFIDGQEMKTRLPCLSRNSCVTIETETLPSGKVRVSVQVEDKELTFDWKVDKQVTLGMIGGLGMSPLTDSTLCFFFGMIFSHEDWKVSVE